MITTKSSQRAEQRGAGRQQREVEPDDNSNDT